LFFAFPFAQTSSSSSFPFFFFREEAVFSPPFDYHPRVFLACALQHGCYPGVFFFHLYCLPIAPTSPFFLNIYPRSCFGRFRQFASDKYPVWRIWSHAVSALDPPFFFWILAVIFWEPSQKKVFVRTSTVRFFFALKPPNPPSGCEFFSFRPKGGPPITS